MYFYTNYRAHQTHYEQMGNLFGKVKLEDTAWNVQKMPSCSCCSSARLSVTRPCSGSASSLPPPEHNLTSSIYFLVKLKIMKGNFH